MYGSTYSLIDRFSPPLTYPISCVYTVILNIGIARLCTLIAVDPVDGSGKRSTILVTQDWGVYAQKSKTSG